MIRAGRECVDLSGGGVLGSWACGGEQPNQRFAVDALSGMVMSGSAGYGEEASFAGQCASVQPPPA